jgi:hypothetical protein
MAVAAVVMVTVAGVAPSRRAKGRPSGGDPSATDLAGRVVELPIRSLGRLEQAQLAGDGGLDRVAVRCCVHEDDYAQGV